MLKLITAAALGLAALVAVPAAAQPVERQTTVVRRGPHGGERVTTRTTVRTGRSWHRNRGYYGRPNWQGHHGYYGRPGFRRAGYGRPGYHAYGRRCWTTWWHGRPVRHCR